MTLATTRTMPTKINNKNSDNNDSGDNNNNNNNLSEEDVAKVVAVEVEACGVHWDEGGQGGVVTSAD